MLFSYLTQITFLPYRIRWCKLKQRVCPILSIAIYSLTEMRMHEHLDLNHLHKEHLTTHNFQKSSQGTWSKDKSTRAHLHSVWVTHVFTSWCVLVLGASMEAQNFIPLCLCSLYNHWKYFHPFCQWVTWFFIQICITKECTQHQTPLHNSTYYLLLYRPIIQFWRCSVSRLPKWWHLRGIKNSTVGYYEKFNCEDSTDKTLNQLTGTTSLLCLILQTYRLSWKYKNIQA